MLEKYAFEKVKLIEEVSGFASTTLGAGNHARASDSAATKAPIEYRCFTKSLLFLAQMSVLGVHQAKTGHHL
jgi:hypothetical protein